MQQPYGRPPIVQVADANNDPLTARNILGVVKDIFVIITCIALLYTLARGYIALNDLKEQLSHLGTVFGS